MDSLANPNRKVVVVFVFALRAVRAGGRGDARSGLSRHVFVVLLLLLLLLLLGVLRPWAKKERFSLEFFETD